jgi:curli biogenesis system outer membrane secretion channel CsgG
MIGRNGFRALVAACMGLLLANGCVTPGTKATVTSDQGGPTMSEVQSEEYDGPKARIAVAQFKDKTGKGWWTGQIGDGMADQLTTALFNTNRYIVLERAILNDVLSEQDLGASGRVRSETAAPIGQIEGAELLVVGAVTEFEGNASGAQGGVGGYGGGVLGGIMGGFRKAHMAIDMRIIDTRTSRVLAATSVEGEASDVNLGGLLGGFGSAGALAGGLSGWKNTPTEKALRVCIKEAVNFVVTKTPQKYYHYTDGKAKRTAPAAAAPAPPPPAPSSGVSQGTSAYVTVSPATLNVRSGPGTNHSVAFGVRGGDRLQVLESRDKWIRIRTQDGKEGWTAGWLTTPAH